MRSPLNQFADRLIRNSDGITGELAEFINGLVDKGVAVERIHGILDARRDALQGAQPTNLNLISAEDV